MFAEITPIEYMHTGRPETVVGAEDRAGTETLAEALVNLKSEGGEGYSLDAIGVTLPPPSPSSSDLAAGFKYGSRLGCVYCLQVQLLCRWG